MFAQIKSIEMYRGFLLSITIICLSSALKAREIRLSPSDTSAPRYFMELVPRISFTQGWRSMLDVSVALRIERLMKWPFTSHSITAGAEWNYGFKKPLLGYKAGYTFIHDVFDFSGYSIGANAVYFTDHKTGGWYVQAQLAYEILDMLELMTQYNIPLRTTQINDRVNQFSVGLRIWMR